MIFACPECTRLSMALNRLKAKHARFAEQTNTLITEQHQELTALRAERERKDQS